MSEGYSYTQISYLVRRLIGDIHRGELVLMVKAFPRGYEITDAAAYGSGPTEQAMRITVEVGEGTPEEYFVKVSAR